MKYFVVINDEQQGPYTIDELAELKITSDTEVWTDGMDQWAPAADVPQLKELFNQGEEVSQNEVSNNDEGFFVVINDEQQGPFSIDELADMGISPDTEVWTEGMDEWEKASNVPALDELFAAETEETYEENEAEENDYIEESSVKAGKKISKRTILAISGVVLLLIIMMITNPSKHEHADKVARNCYKIMFQNEDYESSFFKGFYGNGWDNWFDRSNFLIFSVCKHKINKETVSFGILGMVFTFDDWYKRNLEELGWKGGGVSSRASADGYVKDSNRERNSYEDMERESRQEESHSFGARSLDELSAATADSYIEEGSGFSYSLIEEWSLALSRERLRDSQLYGIDSDFLKLMRNSIYARHGYRFKMERFSSFFNHYDWYSPLKDDVANELSEIEKYNVNLIKSHE